jgi:hypothetical protein
MAAAVVVVVVVVVSPLFIHSFIAYSTELPAI